MSSKIHVIENSKCFLLAGTREKLVTPCSGVRWLSRRQRPPAGKRHRWLCLLGFGNKWAIASLEVFLALLTLTVASHTPAAPSQVLAVLTSAPTALGGDSDPLPATGPSHKVSQVPSRQIKLNIQGDASCGPQ